eukprot:CAMPEP_0179092062 /NCGR_PEP_ID=MMETSP0796-20121207/42086_1 /TAXON_ID=73915 /ORGANISM="Pyrodinium bahamense, Strain pbaha01" /LENGTH=492 /DNA_ID=CAMNT_0020789661 /DNA_START=38 /DNA_END=1516 /DNA_ORIENTATION=-
MGGGASASGDSGGVFKAIEEGNAFLVRKLISNNPAKAAAQKNVLGDTVLHHAAYMEPDGKAKCIEALLEAPGVRHDMTNKAGWTPLHMAAARGCEAPTRALLKYGASCEATEPNGKTPLHLAAEFGHALCIQAALDCLVSPNLLDGSKQTALHVAAQKGHLACVEVLLTGSAAVNAAALDTAGGRTPLHEAAALGHNDVVQALLKAKGDMQARTATGSTAMDLALSGGHKALAAKLGVAPKEEDMVRGKADIMSSGGVVIDSDSDGLAPANEDVRMRVQDLMDETWKGITTRDRGFGKVLHFEVVQVLQNSNKALWELYRSRQDDLSLHFAEKIVDVKTVIESWETCMQEPRKSDVNEFFLFHGTKPTAATAICNDGFNVDLSGSNKGSLYGPGVYCAESSAKADEYAGDDQDGIYKGLFAMLLCRVSLGNPLVNEEVEPDVDDITRQFEAGDRHSIIGDREKVRGTFREFILRDPRQVYPAYAIIYRRKGS